MKIYCAICLVFTATLLSYEVALANETTIEDAPISAIRSAPRDIGVENIFLTINNMQVRVPIKTWKGMRDALVVKQNLDHSCGAASLATLLQGYYGLNVTENVLLEAMDKGEGKSSFDDMKRALTIFGFKAQGFASSWEQLAKLKVPVIVYVKQRKNEHFVVLRGISNNVIWLADPSLGNRTYSRSQFLDLWKTRSSSDNDGLDGKFLAVLPIDPSAKINHPFFSKSPRRHSSMALRQFTLISRW